MILPNRQRRLRAWLIAAVVSLLVPAGAVAVQPLQVSAVGRTAYPAHTLLVSVPAGTPLTADRVHVLENQAPVQSLAVTSLRHGTQGDLGVVVLIDTDPSMVGAPLAHAVAAARALAAQRAGNQELGVMFGDQLTLPLTTDSAAIAGALARPPRGGGGTNLLRDTTSAIKQLQAANIAAGAVIFVSDDIDPTPAFTPQSVAATAAAAGYRIFTVGVRDPAFTPQSMDVLARNAGGVFTEATPSRLPRIFTAIQADLTRQYVVRYRSVVPLGRTISMSLRVDGVPGQYTTSYRSPPPPVAPRTPRRPPHHQSFFASSLAIFLVGLVCALLVGFAILLLLNQLRTRTPRARVSEFLPERVEAPWAAEPAPGTSGLAEVLSRRAWWPRFVENVDIARLDRSALELAYLAGIGSLVLAGLLVLSTGSIVLGLLALITGPIALRIGIDVRVRRERTQFTNQLPSHLEEVAGAIRSGRSLVEAIRLITTAADEPFRTELERALADESLGRPLDETLLPIATRMQADGIEQLAVVAALQRRTGSSVAEVLDQIAEGARDRADLQRELQALTAQGRLARWILTALPPLLLVVFSLINPGYERPMFHTAGGIVALVIGGLMVAAGSWVMKRIVDVGA